MKKLLVLTLTLMLTVLYLASCAKKVDEDARRAMGGYAPSELGFRIIEMDSCEWIAKYETNSTGFFTHRGRCKFCAKKNKETLKEILKGE